MSKLWNDLFGSSAVKEWKGDHQADAAIYGAMANNYGANTAVGQLNVLSGHIHAIQTPPPAPEPKDIPALAISLDAAYDLWTAKYGYEWVNINGVNPAAQQTRYPLGGVFVPSTLQQPFNGPPMWPQATGTFTVTVAPEPPEPEFDWYTVARRLVHVRALENEGGYYRLVPREWCK